MSLLVVGSLAFDQLETPKAKRERIVGGSAVYASIAASYFTDVKMVSIAGYDFTDEYIQSLKNRGIDLEGLTISQEKKTFFWAGKYHDDMNTRTTLVTDLNAFEDFDPVLPDSYQQADYLVLESIQPSLQQAVLDRMAKRPKLVALDTIALWIDITKKELIDVIKQVDLVSINDEEVKEISGKDNLKEAAQFLLDMGLKALVVKKGEHGAMLFTEGKVSFFPSILLDGVEDPTGAGDCFMGAMMGYISKKDDTSHQTLKEAVLHGTAVASFCVEKFGTENVIDLKTEEIDERVGTLLAMY